MQFNPIQFSNEDVSYISPGWEQLEMLTFNISQQIIKDNRKIDRIVTLAKGGWPQTCSLVDFLQVEYVASMGVKFYTGINQIMDKPDIYQDIPPVVRDEHILLFDDVADTGSSFTFVTKHLQDFGVASITTASLFYKPQSTFTPDYYGAKTKAWIVFPFEARETIEQLGPKWRKAGVGEEEMCNRFKQFGFNREFVEAYV